MVAQTLTGGKITWLASTQCLIFPLSNSCAITQGSTTEAIAALDEDTAPTPQMMQRNRTGGGTWRPTNPNLWIPHPPVTAVLVRFAGLLSREEITLNTPRPSPRTAGPWRIAETGGDFGPANPQASTKSGSSIPKTAPPPRHWPFGRRRFHRQFHALSVRDLSQTKFASLNETGVLEVWISN